MRIGFATLLIWVGLSGVAWADKKKPGLFDFAPWKTPLTQQREQAQTLAPATLDLTPAANVGGETRVVHVRVYADGEYRNVVVRWQSKMRIQLERLNHVVQPVFNVRFEVESLREWKRPSTGGTLEEILAQLEAADPATDVDWVVGLTTPFRGVATNVHQIGAARYLARHLVLRGMDDEQEGRFLDKELHMLSGDERAGIYEDRKAHKESEIFLHEWAHTMGVVHNEDPRLIMNPNCDSRQAAFTDAEKEQMALVLDRRLKDRKATTPETADLLRLLESRAALTGTTTEQAAVVNLLRARVQPRAASGAKPTAAAATSSAATAAATTTGMPAAFVERLNAAIAEANAGHRQAAWQLLAPLLAEAEKPPAAGTTVDSQAWLTLARLCNKVGALTAAESALGHAGRATPETRTLAEKIETNRRRLALPADRTKTTVGPEQEPAYLDAFEETTQLLATGALQAARARIAALATDYAGTPGVDLLGCQVDLQANKLGAAERQCAAALAKFDDAAPAHTLAGIIAARANHGAAAEKQFRQAIRLDPSDPTAWRELARYYRASRSSIRATELSAQYEALFSQPLPE